MLAIFKYFNFKGLESSLMIEWGCSQTWIIQAPDSKKYPEARIIAGFVHP